MIEQNSVDEAYLDLSTLSPATDADETLRQALPLAKVSKHRIFTERPLTASIGLANNKPLTKLASDDQKLNGPTLSPKRAKVQFSRPLPGLDGVGKVTAENCRNCGGMEAAALGVLIGLGGLPYSSSG